MTAYFESFRTGTNHAFQYTHAGNTQDGCVLARRQLSARETDGIFATIRYANIHVRGYKEEGPITMAFDMTVLNEPDRFPLVMDAIDRLPQTGDKGISLNHHLRDKLIEHKIYIGGSGEDMPEIRDWKWTQS
jgi:phosphoketolase